MAAAPWASPLAAARAFLQANDEYDEYCDVGAVEAGGSQHGAVRFKLTVFNASDRAGGIWGTTARRGRG